MIRETLAVIFKSGFVFEYFLVFIVSALFILSGITLFRKIYVSHNSYLLVAGGMIFGVLGYLFFLYLSCYLFHSVLWIFLSFILYTFLAIPELYYLYKRFKFPRFSFSRIFLFVFVSIYICFIILLSHTAVTGGDIATYWSISTSFVRGNYPTVSPWQPEYLTVYHMGTSIIMGVFSVLSGLPISVIHFFVSLYFLIAVLLLLVGILHEYFPSGRIFFPVVLFFGSFGGPILYFPRTMHAILGGDSFPQFSQFVGVGGNCGNWFGDYVYCNFRIFGLSVFLMFLFLMSRWTFNVGRIKILFLILLMMLTLTIDETLFLVQAVFVAGLYVSYVYRHYIARTFSLNRELGNVGIFSFFALILFFMLQNPVRDALLNPHLGASRFQTIFDNSAELASRGAFIQGHIKVDAFGGFWYLPDLRLLIGCGLLLSMYLSGFFRYLSISSLVFTGLGFVFVDAYYPSNGYRFFYTAYSLLMIVFGAFLVKLSFHSKLYIRFVSLTLCVVLFIPQLITSHIYIFNTINKSGNRNFVLNLLYKDAGLQWLQKHSSYDARILVVDEYPDKNLYSDKTLQGLMVYGLQIPIAPSAPKVMNLDVGGEWFDAVSTLDPVTLKKQNVNYLYIDRDYIHRFDERYTQLLSNPRYFEEKFTIGTRKIYKVQERYFSQVSSHETSRYVLSKILPKKSVYIDTFPQVEIRRKFILDLNGTNDVYGVPFSKGYDFFMHIEQIPRWNDKIPLEDALNERVYDYIVAPSTRKISGKYTYVPVVSTRFITLWSSRI